MTMDTTHQQTRRSARLAAIGFILMILGGILLSGVFYERAYAGRMYPGVVVLDQAVGGKTYSEAQVIAALRADQFLDTAIELRYPDGATEVVTPRQLGVTLDADALTLRAYEHGRSGNFWHRLSNVLLLQWSGSAAAASPTFDMDQVLSVLETSFVAHESAAVSAALVSEGGALQISPEQAGVRIDRAAISDIFEAAFAQLSVPSVVEVPSEVVTPTVTAQDLTALLSEAQRVTEVPLYVTANTTPYTVSSATLVTWVQADTSTLPAKLSWSSDQISTYLGTFARKIDKPMQPKKISVQDGGVLDAGQVGTQLDRDQALAAILGALETRTEQSSLTPISKTPVALTVTEIPIEEKTITPPFTAGLYAGKYLEVNLKEQMLYQWEGATMVASYTVSTGKWSSPTPEGVLYIKNHISYAYSRKYDLYMPWWLGLAWNPDGSGYEGYGLHELPEWRGGRKEGESHLGTPVSHGCVRLGVGPAQAIYNWAEEGMPVYIHR